MYAPLNGVTGVVGTNIIVVAASFHGSDALTVGTVVINGTGIAVVTIASIGCEGASRSRRTTVVRTRIIVIASQRIATNAQSVIALVFHGTDVAVRAELDIGCIEATNSRITGVVGADIAVIAIDKVRTNTGAVRADFAKGATVGIVARRTFTGRHESADSRRWVTGRCEAGGINALGRGALNSGPLINSANIWQGRGIADERSVAYVPILQLSTIGIDLAITDNRFAATDSIGTVVTQGAGVTVVAVAAHGGKFTAAVFGADILRAGVLIIAHNWLSYTATSLTMVSYCTGISVSTIAHLQDVVDTTLCSSALVLRTLVPIIAKIDEIACYEVRLICIPVAIVVETVAKFGCGICGITVG